MARKIFEMASWVLYQRFFSSHVLKCDISQQERLLTSEEIFNSEADFKFPVLIMTPPQTNADHGVPQGYILGYLKCPLLGYTGKQISILVMQIGPYKRLQ